MGPRAGEPSSTDAGSGGLAAPRGQVDGPIHSNFALGIAAVYILCRYLIRLSCSRGRREYYASPTVSRARPRVEGKSPANLPFP